MDLSTVAKKQTRIQGNREIVGHESAEMYERIADALGSISDLSTNGLQIRTLAASARTEPQVQKDPDTGRPAMSFAAYAVWDKLALMTLVLQGFLLGLANGASCLATCAPLLLPYIVAEGRPIRRSAIMTSECRSNPAPADFAKSHGKAALWSLPMLALSLFMAFGQGGIPKDPSRRIQISKHRKSSGAKESLEQYTSRGINLLCFGPSRAGAFPA